MDISFLHQLEQFKASIAVRGLYVAELRLVADPAVRTQVVFHHEPAAPLAATADDYSLVPLTPPSPAYSARAAVDAALSPSCIPNSPLEALSLALSDPTLNPPHPPPLTLSAAATQPARRHACGRCGASFAYKSKLSRHIDHVHRGIRGKNCGLCDRSFYYNADLHKHRQLVHQGVRPHRCQYCTERFQVRNQLLRHQLEQHGP